MKSFIPALFGLAAVAAAHNSTTDCITAFSKCYDFNTSNANVCESEASSCKDRCSTQNSNCLSSGTSKETCSLRFDQCIGATSSSEVSISCINSAIPCYTGDGSVDNTCDSKIGNCKTACSGIRDICESTGNGNSELCASKYQDCLGSSKVTTPSKSCIQAAEEAYTNGTAFNTAAALTATCKQTCGVLKDACMTANGDKAKCQAAAEKCLGVGVTESSTHCVAEVEALIKANKPSNEVEMANAQCKDFCARGFDTCNSANNSANNATCLAWYSSCVGSHDLPTLSSSCVSSSEASYLNATSGDNVQNSQTADCKTQCGFLTATCLSSGDPKVQDSCYKFRDECLGSSNLEGSNVDCVARNDACYLSGEFTDAECDSKNANCKSLCSRTQDICLSGNSSSAVAGCDLHYSQCLGSANVLPVSPVDCVKIATNCFLNGTADNSCASITATCKSSCSRSQDTCLSSGDPSVKPGCQKHYDTCLGATPEAEEAAHNVNCIARFTSCVSSGAFSDAECNAQVAQCKNTCSGLLDSCNSSGDNSTAPQCQGVYNSCLGSIATSLVDYKPLDCAARNKRCASNSTSSAECDRQNASCRGSCGVTLDVCLTSGSSDRAACDHLYMMCLDSTSYKVTSIPVSMKPTSIPTSASIVPSANATSAGSIPTNGAYAYGSYNGSVSTANAASGGPSVTAEGTAYATDVVQTTVTTCPVGQTVTSGSATIVLTTPSVITTKITVRKTLSRTVAHTITVSATGNNVVPSPKPSSAENTVYITDVVQSTVTTCPAGETVIASGKTTILTEASVITSQVTVKSTIYPVTHTIVPQASSTAEPRQTTSIPVDGHVAVPSTVTLYSTQQVTVTSCGADVTNCPGKSTVISTTVFPTAITVTSVWSKPAPTGSAPVESETTAPVTIASTKFLYSTGYVTITKSRTTYVKTSVIPTGYAVTSVISKVSSSIVPQYTSSGMSESSAPVASVSISSAPVASVSVPAATVPVLPTTAPFPVNNGTMVVAPTGTGAVGTGSLAIPYKPSQYTGAANKASAAGIAGIAAFAAFLL